jgi:hypothetical protein
MNACMPRIYEPIRPFALNMLHSPITFKELTSFCSQRSLASFKWFTFLLERGNQQHFSLAKTIVISSEEY